jgi:hypothetical protein
MRVAVLAAEDIAAERIEGLHRAANSARVDHDKPAAISQHSHVMGRGGDRSVQGRRESARRPARIAVGRRGSQPLQDREAQRVKFRAGDRLPVQHRRSGLVGGAKPVDGCRRDLVHPLSRDETHIDLSKSLFGL